MRAAWRSLGPHPIRVFNRETASGQEYAGEDPSPADQENVAVVGPAPIIQAQGVNPYQRASYVGAPVAGRVLRISQALDRNAMLCLKIR